MYKKIIEDETTEVLSLMQMTETFFEKEGRSIDLQKTELMPELLSYSDYVNYENNKTEYLYENAYESKFKYIEDKVFEGKYIIENEISGGGMSKVYLARHTKLGNKWIIKYIDNKNSFLANEEHILKRLNHINLPKIVDIFHDNDGIYIVETYIEGVSLDKALASGQIISPALALDFAEQFAMVLNYLHTLKPYPIIHCDLKPSNIIITPDNKLVLIDFGISKSGMDNINVPMAATYRYAAPEQLKNNIPDKYKGLVSLRFTDSEMKHFCGTPDVRTDIYSMGAILFEMVTGKIPTVNNKMILKEFISEPFANLIYRCIQADPKSRYTSIENVRRDLQKVKVSKVSMLRSLMFRRIIFIAAIILTIFSATAFVSATYLIQLENGAVITVYPEVVTVSMKQSTEIVLEKIFENGAVNTLNADDFAWDIEDNSIATVSGGNLIGLKQGTTNVVGTYKDKKIYIKINVTDKLENEAEVSLRYKNGSTISLWCGKSDTFETVDGGLSDVSFSVPGSIAQDNDGKIYISDSGIIRCYDGNEFNTINISQDYIKADVIKTQNNDLYVLSDVWYDLEENARFGLYKLQDNSLTTIAEFDALNTNIEDFTISDNNIYCAVSIPYAGNSSLTKIDVLTGEKQVLCDIEGEIKGICINNDIVYMSTYDEYYNQAYILQYDLSDNQLTTLAGIKNLRNFVDSTAIQCFAPTNLQYHDNQLYFMDYNVLRKIIFTEDGPESVTVAGIPSAEFSDEKIGQPVDCSQVMLSRFNHNFLVTDSKIYMTDEYNGYILEINE